MSIAAISPEAYGVLYFFGGITVIMIGAGLVGVIEMLKRDKRQNRRGPRLGKLLRVSPSVRRMK